MQVTYRDCLSAHGALLALAKVPTAFATRIRVAKLLRAVGSEVSDFQQARQYAYQEKAEHVDGAPQGVRGAGGQPVYKLSATDELLLSAQLNALLDTTVQLPHVEPLTLAADFPATLGTDGSGVTADLLAALGPFLDLESAP